jgi:Protein of unknown function (DUF2892)
MNGLAPTALYKTFNGFDIDHGRVARQGVQWNHQNLAQEFTMKTNVGSIDRSIRIVVGLVLIGLAATGTVGWRPTALARARRVARR